MKTISLEDILLIDDASSIRNLWNYKPKLFKPGNLLICLIGNVSCYSNANLIKGQIYKVAAYENYYNSSSCQVKSSVNLEGSPQWWEDDRFELAPEPEFIEYVDVTNQKLLKND